MTQDTKLNFFIVGAAKTATVSLSSLLGLQRQAAIVQDKELHFFSYDKFYGSGWGEYLKLFSNCREKKANAGASTPHCRIQYHRFTVDRIKEHAAKANQPDSRR